MVVAEDAMAFVAVVVQKDVTGAIVKLQKVLSDPLVARSLDTRFARAASFVLTLAQARDRAEAERVIQDAAAPRGTYRAKYEADTVMINGYVGIFGVARVASTAERASPTYDGLGSPSIQPLSAPVGVDRRAASVRSSYARAEMPRVAERGERSRSPSRVGARSSALGHMGSRG